MNARDVLLSIAETIRNDSTTWRQGGEVTDREGNPVMWSSKKFYCGCLAMHITNKSQMSGGRVNYALRDNVYRALKIASSVPSWNDVEGRTASDVVELCEKAAKRLEVV